MARRKRAIHDENQLDLFSLLEPEDTAPQTSPQGDKHDRGQRRRAQDSAGLGPEHNRRGDRVSVRDNRDRLAGRSEPTGTSGSTSVQGENRPPTRQHESLASNQSVPATRQGPGVRGVSGTDQPADRTAQRRTEQLNEPASTGAGRVAGNGEASRNDLLNAAEQFGNIAVFHEASSGQIDRVDTQSLRDSTFDRIVDEHQTRDARTGSTGWLVQDQLRAGVDDEAGAGATTGEQTLASQSATHEVKGGELGRRIANNLRALEVLARHAKDGTAELTDDDRNALQKWQSWGAAQEIFDENDTRFDREREQLKNLLGDADYAAARQTILTAFFTDEDIASAMWSSLAQAGLRDGNVLEPGCGKGSFIATAPDNVNMVGVELDPTTARIAALLNPDAAVRAEDFAKTDIPDNTFSAAIGNVPFSRTQPYDPIRNPDKLQLHDYTISKSIDLTMPGGYVCVVSSNGTADAKGRTDGTGARGRLTDRADFITGVRLPSGADGAFAGDAGTQVGTDILVFRVREEGQEPTERTREFLRTENVSVDGHELRINSFFANHPDHVLGTAQAKTGPYGMKYHVQRDVESSLGDQIRGALGPDIEEAVKAGYGHRIAEDRAADIDIEQLTASARAESEDVVGTVRYEETDDGLAFFQLHHIDGQSQWEPVKPRRKAFAENWKKLIDLRDTTTALLNACSDDALADEKALRTKLNEQYDEYVEAHGWINQHEIKPPRAKTEKQIEKSYAALEKAWREDNAIDNRPFEGDLPDDVEARIADEARQPTAPELIVRPQFDGALSRDPNINGVRALEHYDEDTQTANKGPLFTTNPLRNVRDTSVENLSDALLVLDDSPLPATSVHIADLLDGYDEERVEKELEESGLAFRDPQAPNQWIQAPVYLSGRVYSKLQEAQDAANDDPRFDVNVTALEEAQPPKIEGGVTMNLGATWIPTEVYREFVIDTLEIPEHKHQDVKVVHAGDSWYIQVPDEWDEKPEADKKWGVAARNIIDGKDTGPYNFVSKDKRMSNLAHQGVAANGHEPVVLSAGKTIEHAFNARPPRLNYSKQAMEVLGYDPENTAPKRNEEASTMAMRKTTAISDRFRQWARDDAGRYAKLLDAYNDQFNNNVVVKYSGDHLSFPGMSNKYTPYPYQRDAVARMLHEPGVLLNHCVGAGKTGTMVTGAMELKRLGKANKPMIVVPNHLVEQIAKEANQWYPGARVLSGASTLGGGPQARQQFTAQAALNDWDVIVVPQSTFKLLGMAPEIEADYLQGQLELRREELQILKDSGIPGNQRSMKQIEEQVKKLEEKIEEKLAKKDSDYGLTFDQTGVDYLLVDEAHEYKNLARMSHIQEIAHTGSDKATDLDMKLNYMRQQKAPGTPCVTFSTGTPVTNNIAELWVMTRFVSPEALAEAKVSGVNAWAANFTQSVSALDFTSGGKLVEKQRVSRYVNAREMIMMNAAFLDYVGRESIPVKLPRLRGDEPTVVEFEPEQDVKDASRDLMWREDHQPDEMRIDNSLKRISDGKSATLDPRMANLDPEPGKGRVNAVADQVISEWEANRDNIYNNQQGEQSPNRGGFQIIFCDKGVPDSKTFSLYDALRNELVSRGMDRDRIRFIHEWDNRKDQLFRDCNNGRVDVLIGNTPKLSTGANIQNRTIALHHVDVPWKPADLDQRNGRIIRQGNQNDEVAIYQYVAQGTSDAHSWSTIKRKSGFIHQIFSGIQEMNELDVGEDETEAFARVQAVATGNPDFEKEVVLKRQKGELESKKIEHDSTKQAIEERYEYNVQQIPKKVERKEGLEELASEVVTWSNAETKSWTFNGRTYLDRKDATAALVNALADVAKDRESARQLKWHDIGEIAGVTIQARFLHTNSALTLKAAGFEHIKTVPENLVRDDLVRTAEEEKTLSQSRSGFLSRAEGLVSKIPDKIAELDESIEKMQREVAKYEANPAMGEFPQQDELDSISRELDEVQKRLRQFQNSDAEKAAQRDYERRLAHKGRTHGFTLKLNPTAFMISEGIDAHPESPRIYADHDAAAMVDGAERGEDKYRAAIDHGSLTEICGMAGPPQLGRANATRSSGDMAPANEPDRQYSPVME